MFDLRVRHFDTACESFTGYWYIVFNHISTITLIRSRFLLFSLYRIPSAATRSFSRLILQEVGVEDECAHQWHVTAQDRRRPLTQHARGQEQNYRVPGGLRRIQRPDCAGAGVRLYVHGMSEQQTLPRKASTHSIPLVLIIL